MVGIALSRVSTVRLNSLGARYLLDIRKRRESSAESSGEGTLIHVILDQS